MPHIIIEHDKKTADKLDLAHLAKSMHDTLASQETIKLEAIKTRSIEAQNVIVANGEDNMFIHIEVKLLAGRSETLKEHMGNELFLSAKRLVGDLNCSLSVNISELAVYKK